MIDIHTDCCLHFIFKFYLLNLLSNFNFIVCALNKSLLHNNGHASG